MCHDVESVFVFCRGMVSSGVDVVYTGHGIFGKMLGQRTQLSSKILSVVVLS